MILILIAHLLASVLLFFVLQYLNTKYDKRITIHNMPVIIMGMLFLIASIFLSLTHLALYAVLGFILSLISWFLTGIHVDGLAPVKVIEKVKVCLTVLLFWPQMLIGTAFVLANEGMHGEEP